jgi:hypothetical protein
VHSYVIALASCRNICVLYLQHILTVIFILRVHSYVIALVHSYVIALVHSYVIALVHSYVIALASCRNICILYLQHIYLEST